MLIPMAQVLKLHSDVFELQAICTHVLIILETAHHGTTLRIFCNITQNTTPVENSQKCSIFLHQLHFFLMGRSRTFWGIRIKFHLGRTRGRGKRRVWWKSPN